MQVTELATKPLVEVHATIDVVAHWLNVLWQYKPVIALQDFVLHAHSIVFKTDPSIFEQVFPELHVLVEEVQ